MKYRDPQTGEFKEITVKVADTLPVGTEVDYDGTTVPNGWEEIQEWKTLATEVTVGAKITLPTIWSELMVEVTINENTLALTVCKPQIPTNNLKIYRIGSYFNNDYNFGVAIHFNNDGTISHSDGYFAGHYDGATKMNVYYR